LDRAVGGFVSTQVVATKPGQTIVARDPPGIMPERFQKPFLG
jgi:hypothetical protein